MLCPSTVENIEEVNVGGYVVKTSTEEEDLFTNLLVAADGGNSKVRNLLGFGNWGWKYEQNAIVATVKLNMDELSMGDEKYKNVKRMYKRRICIEIKRSISRKQHRIRFTIVSTTKPVIYITI